MKKLVSIVLAVAMILSLTSVCMTALADPCNNHTYTLHYGGGAYIWQRKNDSYHERWYLQVQVCSKCGTTGAYVYVKPTVPDPKMPDVTERHTFSGQYRDQHIAGTTTHVFYRICSVCNGSYGSITKNCAGGNAHVTYP